MKSRLLPKRRALRSRSLSVTERNRRLVSLGLSRHEDEGIVQEALAIVERFRVWTQHERCCVSGYRAAEVHDYQGAEWIVGVEWAHVVGTRGAWTSDFGATVPLWDLLHREQHRDPTFWAKRDLDPAVLARLHAIRFFAAHPEDADWVIQHANDRGVIALAQAGKAER